jgi:hypothetical protein
MIDTCQEKTKICLPFKKIVLKESSSIDIFQVIDRGGIIETTADHSDIRGLITACHVYVVELPRSNVGS